MVWMILFFVSKFQDFIQVCHYSLTLMYFYAIKNTCNFDDMFFAGLQV